MLASENLLKWAIRFYPPLFFQRIWLVKIEKDFRGAEVRINKSFWNRNYNNSIFGGTIFSAADPFYAVLFYQIFTHKGYKIRGWAKSSEIKFLKPSFTDLSFKIMVNEADVIEAEEILNTVGKYTKALPIQIFDKKGVNVATVMNELYMRNLNFTDHAHSNK